MKILFLTEFNPFPKNSGGKIISFELLRLLSNHNEIYFSSFVDSREKFSRQSKFILNKYCKSIFIEQKPIVYKTNIKTSLLKFFYSILTNKSYRVTKFYSHKMQEYVDRTIENIYLDVIVVCHDSMMQYIPDGFSNKVIYVEIDIISSLYKQYITIENNIIKKIIYLIEYKKLLKYEKKILGIPSRIWSISHYDIDYLLKLGISKKTITYLPIPFRPKYLYSWKNNIKNILFVGSFNWKPNRDGILWFLNEIFPFILSVFPSCKLTLAGTGVHQFCKYTKIYNTLNLVDGVNQNSLSLIKIYKKTTVFIVPIFTGSGIRVKILDALSRGIPAVTTSTGIKGIKLKNGVNILIADEKYLFSQLVLKVLSNNSVANELSVKGYKYIQKYHNNKSIEKVINNLN